MERVKRVRRWWVVLGADGCTMTVAAYSPNGAMGIAKRAYKRNQCGWPMAAWTK